MATKKIKDLSELKTDLYSDKKGIIANTQRLSDDLLKEIKSEVDKANKRLKRMNDFQKGIFEDKGITHISRKGGIKEKLKALSQARIVNESGISTKTEYKKYVNTLSRDLSLSTKEVDYMLSQFDSRTRNFISGSTLKYGSNPQIDFLYEDIIQVNDILQQRIDSIDIHLSFNDRLAEEIIDEIYKNEL